MKSGWWAIAQAIIAGKFYENGKPYEEKIARKRVELIEQGLSPAEARKQIQPLLIKAMLSGQKNTPGDMS